jgi:antitoxin FitA
MMAFRNHEEPVPALTIKGLPEDLYQRLKAAAEGSRRSLNGQAIVCLERGLADQRLDPRELVAELRRWHAKLGRRSLLTDAFLRRAKQAGRR